jgi:hypothetical protein
LERGNRERFGNEIIAARRKTPMPGDMVRKRGRCKDGDALVDTMLF